MTRSSDEFTDVIEAWLDTTPAYEDVESVVARIVAEVDDTPQQGPAWGWWGRLDSSMVVGFGLGAAATILIALIGAQFLGGTGQGAGSAPTGPPASPIHLVSPSPRPSRPTPDVPSVPPTCPPTASGSSVDVTPTTDMRGLVGLPADGATPSAPEQGQLVDCWPVAGGHVPYRGMVRLYADGRLIWNYYYPLPIAETTGTTGHIEQRLTPDGVALVRAMDDIGLKDPLRLAEWLPASAWEDQTMRPYVPSGYGVCLFVPDGAGTDQLLTVSEKLALLPIDVADMLRGSALVPEMEPASYGETPPCLGVTLAEARLVDEELRRLGFEQPEVDNQYLLQYILEVDSDRPGVSVIEMWFEPIFPDGSIGCSACG